MIEFSKFTAFSPLSGVEGADYQLDEPLTWEIGRKGSGFKLELEKGYKFNLSVPWFLSWLLSPHNKKVLLAAAVHDKLTELDYDIAFSSAEFRRAAIARGYNPVGAWALFIGTFVYLQLKQIIKGK